MQHDPISVKKSMPDSIDKEQEIATVKKNDMEFGTPLIFSTSLSQTFSELDASRNTKEH
jgi:hypothetical protein